MLTRVASMFRPSGGADLVAATRPIAELLAILIEQVENMSGSLASLRQQVESNTSVVQSAVTLIQGFAQRLADAGTDPAALEQLRTDIAASDTALSAAVAANTPAAPAAPDSPAAPAA